MIWTEHSTQFSLRWAGNRGQKSGAVNLPPLILAPVKEISSRDRWFCWPAWGVKKCRNTGFLCLPLPSTLWCIQGRETIILPPELCKTLLWLFCKTYSSDFFPRPMQLLEHFSLLPITTIFTSHSRSTEHLEDSGGPFHHPDTAAWVRSLLCLPCDSGDLVMTQHRWSVSCEFLNVWRKGFLPSLQFFCNCLSRPNQLETIAYLFKYDVSLMLKIPTIA